MRSDLDINAIEAENAIALHNMVNPPRVSSFDDSIIINQFVYCILDNYLVAIVDWKMFAASGAQA